MNAHWKGKIALLGAMSCSISVGGGCGASDAPVVAVARPASSLAASMRVAPLDVSLDPLGSRPELPAPAPFIPPVPVVSKRADGPRVWLLERHSLPIVSIHVVVPAGAASDPAALGGLALATANMLDEGSGVRGPLEVSRDIDRLGASLQTGAYADYAFAALTTLKKNLVPAAAILTDVIAKPSFLPVEWKRVHELWLNDLRARQSEPDAVAAVVAQRQIFGDAPYGHPTNGTLGSAAKVSLGDVRRFYNAHWRPETATVIAVGDITQAELNTTVDRLVATWKAPSAMGAPNPSAPPLRAAKTPPPGPRVVIVDRPDAPQAVLLLARRGVAAADPVAPMLARINTALGGSFTSRLNQDLREEHGWSYGARSRFSFNKDVGIFSAQAAVHTEHAGEALKAMLKDVEALSKEGLTAEELEKTRLIARSELVDAFATVEGAARRLARNAGVGLAVDHEVKASLALDKATPSELKLAAGNVAPDSSVVIVVGPRAKLQPQLEAIGKTKFETVGPEGD